MPFCNADVINYFIEKARSCAGTNPYESRSWLLTATSLAPSIFQIQLEAYNLEKRLQNAAGAATTFVNLFRKFMNCLDDEIGELGNAVRNHHMNKGVKDTPEHDFLLQVFNALPKEIQMEVLMQRSEHTTVIYEKCQFMLLLVKLYPNTVDTHGVGAELLYNVLGCESDVFSTFRSLLVNELVPAVLQLSKNLSPSKRLIVLLNQCIEYFTMTEDPLLAGRSEDFLELTAKRWDKLFGIVDQIGVILSWTISPFFSGSSHTSSSSLEGTLHSLVMAYQHKAHYNPSELAYVSVVLFLRCLVTAHQLSSYSSSNFGGPSNLTLVEIFYPTNPRHRSGGVASGVPSVVNTVSQNYAVSPIQTSINSYFVTGVKLWQLITSGNNGNGHGDPIEKEVRTILTSLQMNSWSVFERFLIDYRIYTGKHSSADIPLIQHPLKLASLLCAMNNFKGAGVAVVKALEAIPLPDGNRDKSDGNAGANLSCEREDLSFYNYDMGVDGRNKMDSLQKRFHFISEDRVEWVYYAVNILIKCFYETLDRPSSNELCVGHLLTVLQLEWPSPYAELVMDEIVSLIRKRGQFSYFPYFGDFVIEPDFLETFLAIANQESKGVLLELFIPTGSRGSGTRRMGTRGADKGVKNDLKQAMERQMRRNDGTVRMEMLIHKFMATHSLDLIHSLNTL